MYQRADIQPGPIPRRLSGAGLYNKHLYLTNSNEIESPVPPTFNRNNNNRFNGHNRNVLFLYTKSWPMGLDLATGWVWQNGGYACTTTVVTETTQALTGQCPDSTLYGSLDPLGNIDSTTGANSAEVPSIDSLNVFSSAYEVLGLSADLRNKPRACSVRCHLANKFTKRRRTDLLRDRDMPELHHIRHGCPNTSISTTINAPISAAYSSRTGWSGLNIFSTSFPGQNYSDNSVNTAEDFTDRFSGSSIWMTSDSNDVYPPAIAACTPATNSSDGGVTTTPSSWWNWHGNNASGNCGNESAANRAAYVSTPGQPQFSNCSLVI